MPRGRSGLTLALLISIGAAGGCRSEVDLGRLDRTACAIQLRKRVCAPKDLPLEECRLASDDRTSGLVYGEGWSRLETRLERGNPGMGPQTPIEVTTPCDDDDLVALQVPDGFARPFLLCNLDESGCPARPGSTVECRIDEELDTDLGPGHTAASLASDGEHLAAAFAEARTDTARSRECADLPGQPVTNLRLNLAVLGTDLQLQSGPSPVPDQALIGPMGELIDPPSGDGLRPLTWSRPWLGDQGAQVMALTDVDTLSCAGGLQENSAGGLLRIALDDRGAVTSQQSCNDLSPFLYGVDVAPGGDERYAALAVDCNLLTQGRFDYFCYGDGLLVHPVSTLGVFCNDDFQPQPFPLSGVAAVWSDAIVLREVDTDKVGGDGEVVPLAATSFFSSDQAPTLVVRLYPQLTLPGEQPSFTLAFPQTLIRGSSFGYSAPQPPTLVQGKSWAAIVHGSRDLGLRAALIESTGMGGVQRSERSLVPDGIQAGAPVPRFASGGAEDLLPVASAASDDGAASPTFGLCYPGLDRDGTARIYFWSTLLVDGRPLPAAPPAGSSFCAVGAAPASWGASFVTLVAGGQPGTGGPASMVLDVDLGGSGPTRQLPVVGDGGAALQIGRCPERQLVRDGEKLLLQECGTIHSLTLDLAGGRVLAEALPRTWPGQPVLRREPAAPDGPETVVLWRDGDGPLVRTTLYGSQPGAEVTSFEPRAERMARFRSALAPEGQISTQRILNPALASPLASPPPSVVLAQVGDQQTPARSVLPRNARPVQDFSIVPSDGAQADGRPGADGLPVVSTLFDQGQRIAVTRLAPDFDGLFPSSEYPLNVTIRQHALRPVDDSLTLVLVVGPAGDLVMQQVESVDLPGPTSTFRLYGPIGTPRPLDVLRGQVGLRSPALVPIAPGLYGASAVVRRGADRDGNGGELVRVLVPIDASGQRLGEPLELGTELTAEATAFSERGLAAQADTPLVLARETLIRHGSRLVSSVVVDGHTRIRRVVCEETPAP